MIRIHANGVALEVERELAVFDVLQLVLVQVGPAPDARVDDVGKALAARDLQAPVERSLYRDALAGMGAVGGDGGDQRVQLVALLL